MKKLFTIVFLLVLQYVNAADYTWVGSSGGAWNSSANWSPNTGFPSTGDRALFTGTANVSVAGLSIDIAGIVVSTSGTITLSGTANSFTIGASGIATTNTTGTVTIADGGNTITLNGGIAVTTGGTFTHSGLGKMVFNATGVTVGGGSNTITFGNLEIAAGVSISVNATNSITVAGNLNLIAGSNLNLPISSPSRTLLLGPSSGTTGGTVTGTGTLTSSAATSPANITINTGGASNIGTLYFGTGSVGASTLGNININRPCTLTLGSANNSQLNLNGGVICLPTTTGTITINNGGINMSIAGNNSISNNATVAANVVIQGSGKIISARSVANYNLTTIATANNTITLPAVDINGGNGTSTTQNVVSLSTTSGAYTYVTGAIRFLRNYNTLATGNNLVLVSNASGTASIGDITNNGTVTGNIISGNVSVQRFLQGGSSIAVGSTPGRRAFRFFSHPFTAAYATSGLGGLTATGNIDITGADASFTSTATNNPSAFWYDPSISGAGSGAEDLGWVAFTSANGTGTNNTWNVGQGIRALVRGAKGEGLNGVSNYTLSDVTLNLTGALNTGNQTWTLANSGTNATGWNLLGNPYAAPINVQAILNTKYNAGAGNISAMAYVWNPNKANTARGGYDAIDISSNGGASPYILPAMGCVFVQSTISTSHTIGLTETNKSTATANLGFRDNTGVENALKIVLQNAMGEALDASMLRFNKNSKTAFDNLDGSKLLDDNGIYFLSATNQKLAIDSRPIPTDNTSIALGFQSNNNNKQLQFLIEELNMPNHLEAFLVDHYMQTKTLIHAGLMYAFQRDNQPASYQVGRFEIVFAQKSIQPSLVIDKPKSMLQIWPNPTQDFLQVQLTNPQGVESIAYTIVGADGRKVASKNGVAPSSLLQPISVKSLPVGQYFLQVTIDGVQESHAFTKQ